MESVKDNEYDCLADLQRQLNSSEEKGDHLQEDKSKLVRLPLVAAAGTIYFHVKQVQENLAVAYILGFL